MPDTVYRIHNGVLGEEKRSLLQPVQEKELFQSSQWRNRLCDNFPFGFLETFSYIQEAVEGLLPERAEMCIRDRDREEHE